MFCVLYVNTVNNRLIQTMQTFNYSSKKSPCSSFQEAGYTGCTVCFWITKKDQYIRALFQESDHTVYMFVFQLSPLAGFSFSVWSVSVRSGSVLFWLTENAGVWMQMHSTVAPILHIYNYMIALLNKECKW